MKKFEYIAFGLRPSPPKRSCFQLKNAFILEQNSPMFSALRTGGGGEGMVPCEQPASTQAYSSVCVSGVHAHLALTQMESACTRSPAAHASEDARVRLPAISVARLQYPCGPLVAHDLQVGNLCLRR